MIIRCDSAAMVAKTSELLPEPDTPVNTVSRRLGISTLTSLRLFSRAPWTRIRSWLSATCVAHRAPSCGRTGGTILSVPTTRGPTNPGRCRFLDCSGDDGAEDDDGARAAFRRGLRLGIPFGVVGFLLSLSFGVLARQAGFSAAQAIVTAAIVFAGSAQFAMLSVITAGGGIPAALTAAGLMNARFLAMGVALAPVAPGRPAEARRPGPDRRRRLVGAGQPRRRHLRPVAALRHHAAAVRHLDARRASSGAVFGDALGDTHRLGLDAIYPVFFLSLLIAELRDPASRRVAVVRRPRSRSRWCRSPPRASRSWPPARWRCVGLVRRPS